MLTGIAATRQLSTRIQTELGLEEYTGYIPPCDEQSQSDLKLLQVAQLGKSKERAHEGAALSDDSAEI
ncbi:hypothetical protein PR002_g31151 [Phytophthora rubi]|uniref:Uncharacterized protein n=2 Tax=Phytophthora rubi TaxID=129364 RepID=A0A6A3GJI1_9STRA|nr:hypothetical protein PR002_g31151 [Phytophthora rubi]